MLSGFSHWLNQHSIAIRQNKEIQNKQQKQFYYLSLLNNNNKWHIHGLWPQYEHNKYPSFCNKNENFDYNSIKPILNELNTNWYSDKETNEEFWKHEWLKHGTCMFNNCSEQNYFKTALNLFDESKSKNVIEKYVIKGTNKSMIPYNLNFDIINN